MFRQMLSAALLAATMAVPPAALAQDRGNWQHDEGPRRDDRGGMRGGPSGDRGAWQRGDWGSWQPRPAPTQPTQPAPTQPAPPRPDVPRPDGFRPGGPGPDWRGGPARPWGYPAPSPAPRFDGVPPRSGVDPRQPPRNDWRGTSRPDVPRAGVPGSPDWQWRQPGRPGWGPGVPPRPGDPRRWDGHDRNGRPAPDWNRVPRWDDRGRWDNRWRSDRRYDWRSYRYSNRELYRMPRYYAPHGWGYGYRRFSIGITISTMLFAPQYWIAEPYAYRLPEAYGPYRWVRYYNDALLVDIYSGEVVDVIYGIFW